MEDVIQTYQLPYDPRYPVICFDEACQQLFGEVRPTQRPRPGRPARMDYEYERKGVCHQFMMCEPLRGWRHVRVTTRRTRQDYARCVRELVETYYPQARKIRLVQDNLHTHDGASLYEAFAPQEARRLLDKIEFHYTPKHGSWLNMAETEIGIMKRQCLQGRWTNRASWRRRSPPGNANAMPSVCAFIGPLPWLSLDRNSANFTRQSKIDGPLEVSPTGASASSSLNFGVEPLGIRSIPDKPQNQQPLFLALQGH